LPEQVKTSLIEHLKCVRRIHKLDIKEGFGQVNMPFALSRKYPNASREWGWKYVFPATKRYRNPRTGEEGRHHIHETAIQKNVKKAIGNEGIIKYASCHTFRHYFATHLL